MLEIATAYGLAMTNSETCCVKPISINYITKIYRQPKRSLFLHIKSVFKAPHGGAVSEAD